jgi:hypothetical protein
MNANNQEQELRDRLKLIENMIAEGRRTTENWGWTFVLWGVAYYVAIAWSTWGNSALAWPVTMTVAFLATAVVATNKARNQPKTKLGRAIASVWVAMGISLFVLMLAMGISGRLDSHTSVAIVGAMLGTANATSSMILKWKLQFGCAVVWWAAAVAACFVSENQCTIAFLAAIFLCQIVFGVYCMISETQQRKQQGAIHA